MKIEVTQEHIDKGVQYSCSRCPLARALSVHFPTARVGKAYWWESIAANKLNVLPAEALRFREDFDNGRPVRPFTFDV